MRDRPVARYFYSQNLPTATLAPYVYSDGEKAKKLQLGIGSSGSGARNDKGYSPTVTAAILRQRAWIRSMAVSSSLTRR